MTARRVGAGRGWVEEGSECTNAKTQMLGTQSPETTGTAQTSQNTLSCVNYVECTISVEHYWTVVSTVEFLLLFTTTTLRLAVRADPRGRRTAPVLSRPRRGAKVR